MIADFDLPPGPYQPSQLEGVLDYYNLQMIIYSRYSTKSMCFLIFWYSCDFENRNMGNKVYWRFPNAYCPDRSQIYAYHVKYDDGSVVDHLNLIKNVPAFFGKRLI